LKLEISKVIHRLDLTVLTVLTIGRWQQQSDPHGEEKWEK
jgi:hypothetical protein